MRVDAPLRKLIGGDKSQHRLASNPEHDNHESAPRVKKVVRRLVVDDVAAWLPKGFTGVDHALGFTLKFE